MAAAELAVAKEEGKRERREADGLQREWNTRSRHPNDVDWETVHELWGTATCVSEGELVRDALASLCLGYDGMYMGFDDAGEFAVRDGVQIQQYHRGMLERICQPGKHLRGLRSCIEAVLEDREKLQTESFTRIAFFAALRDELSSYTRLIGDLRRQASEGASIPWDKDQWRQVIMETRMQQAQPQPQRQPQEREEEGKPQAHRGSLGIGQNRNQRRPFISLGRLLAALFEWSEVMLFLDELAHSLKDLSGGPLLETVSAETNEGNLMTLGIMRRLMHRSLAPLKEQALTWMRRGQLAASGQDLFIQGVGKSKGDGEKHQTREGKAPLELWHHGFRLLQDQVPQSVIPLPLAKAVFCTGRSVHFLIHACQDMDEARSLAAEGAGEAQKTVGAAVEGSVPWAQRDVLELEEVQAAVSGRVEKRLLNLMKDGFDLLEHCQLIKEYVLFSRGDFVQALLAGANRELDRKAHNISRTFLAGCLETAVQVSQPTANKRAHLERLHIQLMPPEGPNSKGWDVFYVEYVLDPPLTAVITAESAKLYQQISKLLIRLHVAVMLMESTGRVLADCSRQLNRMAAAAVAASRARGSSSHSASEGRARGSSSGGTPMAGPGASAPSPSLMYGVEGSTSSSSEGKRSPKPGMDHRLSSSSQGNPTGSLRPRRGSDEWASELPPRASLPKGYAADSLAAAQARRKESEKLMDGSWYPLLHWTWHLWRLVEHHLRVLLSYLIVGAVGAEWHAFTQQFKEASSLEDVVRAHDRYVRAIHGQCFLGPSRASRDVQEAVGVLLGIADKLNRVAISLRGYILAALDKGFEDAALKNPEDPTPDAGQNASSKELTVIWERLVGCNKQLRERLTAFRPELGTSLMGLGGGRGWSQVYDNLDNLVNLLVQDGRAMEGKQQE